MLGRPHDRFGRTSEHRSADSASTVMPHHDVIVLSLIGDSEDVLPGLVGISWFRHPEVPQDFGMVIHPRLRKKVLGLSEDVIGRINNIVGNVNDVQCSFIPGDELDGEFQRPEATVRAVD